MKKMITMLAAALCSLFTWQAVGDVVAKVGSTEYTTLADALSAASAGQVITVQADCTLPYCQTVKAYTLDLNQHTVTAEIGSGTSKLFYWYNGTGVFVVKNGTINVPSRAGVKNCFYVSGTTSQLKLSNVTVNNYGTGDAINLFNGQAEIDGCTIVSDKVGCFYISGGNTAAATLTNSSFKKTNATSSVSSCVIYAATTKGSVSISDCTIEDIDPNQTTSGRESSAIYAYGTVTLSGGMDVSGAIRFNAAQITGGGYLYGTVKINGGTYSDFRLYPSSPTTVNQLYITKGKFDSSVLTDTKANWIGYNTTAGASRPTGKTGDWYVVGKVEDDVCSIGSKTYTSLDKAIAAVQTGETIKMLADMSLESTVSPSVSFTLDFNGKTVSSTDLIGPAFSMTTGETLTLSNGTFRCGEDCTAFAQATAVDANVIVTEMTVEDVGDAGVLFKQQAGGVVEVRAGTYSVNPTSFLGDGYAATLSGDVWTVKAVPTTPKVAQVASSDGLTKTKYETLAAALAALGANETLTVLLDCEMDAPYAPTAENTFTIDFNGKTVTGTATSGWYFHTGAPDTTIKLRNGTFVAEGGGSFGFAQAEAGKIELEDMTVEAGGSEPAVSVKPATAGVAATITIDGSTISAASGRTAALVKLEGTDAVCTISASSTIDATAATSGAAIETSGTTLELTDGTFNGALSQANAGEISVSGGTFGEKPTAFLAEGYMVTGASAPYTVVPVVAELVEKNGARTAFDNLDDALSSVPGGATLTVKCDAVMKKKCTLSNSCTIDLGGRTVQLRYYGTSGGVFNPTGTEAANIEVTIRNGKFELLERNCAVYSTYTTLLLDRLETTVKAESNSSGLFCMYAYNNSGTRQSVGTVSNCVVTVQSGIAASYGCFTAGDNQKWVICGKDTLIDYSARTGTTYPVLTGTHGELWLEDGEVRDSSCCMGNGGSYGSLFRITGGTLKATGIGKALNVSYPSSDYERPTDLIITGGTIDGPYVITKMANNTPPQNVINVTITGGRFTSTTPASAYLASPYEFSALKDGYYTVYDTTKPQGPSAEKTEDGSEITIDKKSDGVYEIKLTDATEKVSVNGLASTDKVEIPSQVTEVKGLESSDQVVVKTSKGVNITDVVTVTFADKTATIGDLVEKDGSGNYTTVDVTTVTGVETVRVNPEISDVTVDDSDVPAVAEDGVGVRTIPGLKYQLLASEDLSAGVTTPASAVVTAEETSTKLAVDSTLFAPTGGKAFFKVQVTK